MKGLALVLALGAIARVGAAQRVKLGYTAESSARQDSVERRQRALVDAAAVSRLHRELTRRPHPAGSPGSREVIAFLERTLRSYGLDVERHDYQAWLSQPERVAVTMTAPTRRPLTVAEPVIPGDATATHPELGPGYIAYSASGDVEAELVYVNYGLPDDYAKLRQLGVSLDGRIAIARYGRSHRAVKVFGAQQAGARALILYSDPADDGAPRGTTWPPGYWRDDRMLQRGNAKFSWYFHGDPLTPGVAAVTDAQRLDPAQAPTLPTIPVVVLAWREARPLLEALGGATAPPEFRGVLAARAHVGPGPARARVAVRMRNGLRPISNVVASVRGVTEPDRLVLLGGHHDAWTFGGVDPGTATASLLEVARTLGALAQQGLRPRRTISIAFWDAEEFGLIGSTEYAEELRTRLQEQLVLYSNSDLYMRGRFDPGGAPSLQEFMVDVARDIPAGKGSLYDAWRVAEWSRNRATGGDSARYRPSLKALGSGADFVAFQDFLGVPTLSVEFVGPNGYGFGPYHSNFDSRAYAERVADPGFRQGAELSRVLGTLALRMANADLLPFRFTEYAGRIHAAITGANEWMQSPGTARGAALNEMQRLSAQIFTNAFALDHALDTRLSRGPIAPGDARELNDLLARMDQLLTDDGGTPGSRWYRHVIWGWNIYSLYDGQPFPGLADAIRVGDPAQVSQEIERIERALQRMADALKVGIGILDR